MRLYRRSAIVRMKIEAEHANVCVQTASQRLGGAAGLTPRALLPFLILWLHATCEFSSRWTRKSLPYLREEVRIAGATKDNTYDCRSTSKMQLDDAGALTTFTPFR